MRALAALTLLFAVAQPPAGRTVTLALPHALREGESAVLLVTAGRLPRGARIEIATTSGRFLGEISPFGIRAGHEAGTYTVPIPADAMTGKRLCLLLSLDFEGKQRAPTAKEVKKVRVKIRRE